MKRGYFKMYWEFLDDLTPESALLLAYLIAVEPVMKNKEDDYFRLSNSFLQEKFQTWSEYVIKTHLQELVDKGYIEVQQKFKVEFKRGCATRWVKLKYKPEDNTENNIEDKHEDNPKYKPEHKPEKFELNNNNINSTINKYKCNKTPYNEDLGFSTTSTTSSANNLTENETISYNEPQAHLNQFDEIKSYVLQLTSINDETKDYLLGWIEQNISSKSLTVTQLRAILKDLYQQCNNDLQLVSQSIKETYLKSWKNFYVPKNIPVEKKQYNIEKPEEKQEIAEPIVISDLHSFLNP